MSVTACNKKKSALHVQQVWFLPNAVLKALGCFYSGISFIFFSIMVEDLTSVVPPSERPVRLKSLPNPTVL